MFNLKREGSGKTIIFIHGLADDLNYWKPLMQSLKDDYEVISYDLRGHGKSVMDDRKITLDLLVSDLNDMMDSLKIDSACLVGFSLGGYIALLQALTNPSRVSALVLMSTTSEYNEKMTNSVCKFENALENGFDEFYDVIINYALPEDLILKNALKIEKAKTGKMPNMDAIKQSIRAGKNHHCTDRIKDIEIPTLILSGADDELTSIELQEILSNRIKYSKWYIFENTKHNLLIGRNIPEIIKYIKEFYG